MRRPNESNKNIYIHSETGEFKYIVQQLFKTRMYNFSNGKLLRCSVERLPTSTPEENKFRLRLDFLSPDTYEIEKTGYYLHPSENRCFVEFAQLNDDGSLILYYDIGWDSLGPEAVLLDSDFNVINTISMPLHNNSV